MRSWRLAWMRRRASARTRRASPRRSASARWPTPWRRRTPASPSSSSWPPRKRRAFETEKQLAVQQALGPRARARRAGGAGQVQRRREVPGHQRPQGAAGHRAQGEGRHHRLQGGRDRALQGHEGAPVHQAGGRVARAALRGGVRTSCAPRRSRARTSRRTTMRPRARRATSIFRRVRRGGQRDRLHHVRDEERVRRVGLPPQERGVLQEARRRPREERLRVRGAGHLARTRERAVQPGHRGRARTGSRRCTSSGRSSSSR